MSTYFRPKTKKKGAGGNEREEYECFSLASQSQTLSPFKPLDVFRKYLLQIFIYFYNKSLFKNFRYSPLIFYIFKK